MTLAAGTKLGRYENRSKNGAGEMGEVYHTPDQKLISASKPLLHENLLKD